MIGPFIGSAFGQLDLFAPMYFSAAAAFVALLISLFLLKDSTEFRQRIIQQLLDGNGVSYSIEEISSNANGCEENIELENQNRVSLDEFPRNTFPFVKQRDLTKLKAEDWMERLSNVSTERGSEFKTFDINRMNLFSSVKEGSSCTYIYR